MLRTVVSNLAICGIFPFSVPDSDTVKTNSESVRNVIEEFTKEQSGTERLYYMFSTDEFGDLSPEFNSCLQVGFFGSFIGAVYGGINQSKQAYLNFIENNQATSFKNHLEAKKKLQDQVSINFAKGAFKWGWRLGFFSSSYILITTTISVYRGKSSIIEYVAGGGISGALYKTSHGPRGMLVGGLLGSALGCVAGCLSLSILKLTGISMEEVRYWQHKFHSERQEKFRKAIKEHKEKDDIELLKRYEKRNVDLKHNLDNINTEK